LGAPSSSNKRLAWPAIDAFGIRAIHPRPKDQGSSCIQIKWNDAGKITEFKVMLRPLKAVNLIHQKMAEMLQAGR
jgi:hypothetical protein